MKVDPTLGACVLGLACATGCSLLLLDDGYSSTPSNESSNGPSDSSVVDEEHAPHAPIVGPLPSEGVHDYVTTGRDALDGFIKTSNDYGPRASASVVHRGESCFALTFDIRSGYEETMEFCRRGSDVVQESGVRSQVFFGIGATTTQTCSPGDVYLSAAPSAGNEWTHTCNGKNKDGKSGDSEFTTAGPYRFVGAETLAVDGRDTSVMHYHDERTVSGSQTGTNVADWYFAETDGLLVRLTRDISIEYKAPVIGRVHYTEHLEMNLTTTSAEADAAADGSK
jgi:hypothetical protein